MGCAATPPTAAPLPRQDNSFLMRMDLVPIANVVAASITAALLLAYWVVFMRRVAR